MLGDTVHEIFANGCFTTIGETDGGSSAKAQYKRNKKTNVGLGLLEVDMSARNLVGDDVTSTWR